MFENFSKTIHTLGTFSEHDYNLLAGYLKALSYPKDYCILKEGKICQSVFFVNKGGFRQYYVADSGEEIIQNLFVENDWVLEYESFTSQKPSVSIIQATENSEVFELSVHDLHKLMKLSDSFFQVARIFQYTMEQQKFKLQKAPKERYINLLVNKPQVIQKFPLKYIASYLAMTPETLSRVRRSIS